MLETSKSRCPYCGETIELVVDCSVEIQQYTEDCEVCCQPILVSVIVRNEGNDIEVSTERE